MSRRRRAVKRPIARDPNYNSPLVTRLVNTVMKCGKKSTAQRIVYGAFAQIAEKNTGANPLDILQRARLNQHHRITREQLSVREHMSLVLRTLQGRRFVEFADLFDTRRGVPVVVVTFIALLELARERLVDVTQAEAFAPIYVRLAYQPA